jgi:hypothetical protein
MRLGSKM